LQESLPDGRKTAFGIPLSFRPSQMRCQNYHGFLFYGASNGGERFPDAQIVAYFSVLNGNIQIRTHEDSAALQLQIPDSQFRHNLSVDEIKRARRRESEVRRQNLSLQL
jgi:hypothetical protein